MSAFYLFFRCVFCSGFFNVVTLFWGCWNCINKNFSLSKINIFFDIRHYSMPMYTFVYSFSSHSDRTFLFLFLSLLVDVKSRKKEENLSNEVTIKLLVVSITQSPTPRSLPPSNMFKFISKIIQNSLLIHVYIKDSF